MSPTLGLRYAPHLDARTLHRLEMAARYSGLPLSQVELLGQDAAIARGYADAVACDAGARFLATVDWDHLEGLYQSHQVTVPSALRV